MNTEHKNALIIFAILCLTYAYFFQDPDTNGNSRLGLTAAIVQESRLTIDSFHDDKTANLVTSDKAYFNGHYYTDKAIGSSLLAAIPYAVLYWAADWSGHPISPWKSKHWLTFLVIGLPSALAGAMIFLFCVQISGNSWLAGVVTAAVALGTMSFPFSVVFFGHQLAASLLWIGFFLIFQLRFRSKPPAPGYLLLCGLAPGLALMTEYTTAVIGLFLAGYLLYVLRINPSLRKVQTILIAGMAGLLPIFVVMGYNQLVYGHPLATGYQYLLNPGYQENMAQGIMGIGLPNLTVLFFATFHPAMGLFWQSPVLLLVAPGFFYLFHARSYRVEGGLALLAFCAFLLIDASYFQWWGGWSFGPRHIIPMLPFLCIPLIATPRRLYPVLAILTLVSIAQMLIVAASTVLVPDAPMYHILEMGFFDYSTIYNYCWQMLMNGAYAWNLGQALFELPGWTGLVPLIIAITGVGIYLKKGIPHQENISA